MRNGKGEKIRPIRIHKVAINSISSTLEDSQVDPVAIAPEEEYGKLKHCLPSGNKAKRLGIL
jgi:hypothetical protein